MKASDLPALPPARVFKPVPQDEIDRINELYAGMRRQSKQLLKDAMEIGDWFIKVRQDLPRDQGWHNWLGKNFPKMNFDTVLRFIKVAQNREFIQAIMREDSLLSVKEATLLISQRGKMPKPRVRAVVVPADAEPHVLLEAKLKNYVISLYLLRYLEVEAKGLLESMDLTPDQVVRILEYVCRDHPEVKDEVLKVFRPKPKLLPKDA